MFNVGDHVEITDDIPGYALRAGDRGIIVAVRRDNRTLAVAITRDGTVIGTYDLHYVTLRRLACADCP